MRELSRKFSILKDSICEDIYADLPGYPSGVYVTIYDRNGEELTEESSVTLPLQLTVSGECSAGEFNLSVEPDSDLDNVAFRQSLHVTNTKKQTESVTVNGIEDSAVNGRNLSLLKPLSFTYESGDLISDYRVKRTLTAAETEDEGANYRARFRGQIADKDHIIDVLFDVVPHKVLQPLDSSNLELVDPMLYRQLPSELPDWESTLDLAWTMVLQNLEAIHINPSDIMDSKTLLMLQHYKFKVLLAEMGITSSRDGAMLPYKAVEYYNERYSTMLQQLQSPAIGWIDDNQDLKPSVSEAKPKKKGFLI